MIKKVKINFPEFKLDKELEFKKGINVVEQPNKWGKAQPLWSNVLTPNGFVEIGKLKVGDDIISGLDGSIKKVIGVYPQGKKDIYKISFTKGQEVYSCGEHLWNVIDMSKEKDKQRGVNKTLSLNEIINYGLTFNKQGAKKFKIPKCKNIQFNNGIELLIDPYVLGMLISEGSLQDGVRFDNPELDIINKIEKIISDNHILSKVYSGGCYRCNIKGIEYNKFGGSNLKQSLKFYGLLGKNSIYKFIPKEYLYSSIDNRLKLLQGLFDGDGSITESGKRLEYTTSSSILADNVMFILNSLGFNFTFNTRIGKYKKNGIYKEVNKSYIIDITGDLKQIVSSEKHLSKIKEGGFKNDPFISSIEMYSNEEAVCIKVENELYITDDFIVTHNTTFINTIMSMYTGYFGRVKKVPTGFASIETDKGTFNLVKGNWIGSILPDPLARYAIVGSFFNDTKSTVEQREILTKFLGVDYDGFINNYIDDYLKSMDESAQEYYKSLGLGLAKLKEDLKTAKNHEGIIIDDITRLKGETLAFKTQEFKDVEQFYLDQENVNSKIREHNLKQSKIVEDNNKITSERNSDNVLIIKLEHSVQSKEEELERFRTEYEQINSTVCFNCGSAMKIPEDKLKLIQAKGEDIKKELKNIKATLKLLKDKKYPEPKESNYLGDVVKACEVLKLKLPSIPEQRLIEYDNYKKQVSQLEIVKRELTIKEKQLSEINTVRLEDCIQIYTQATESFNKDLEVKVKTTGLNIELFKTLKNGNIESTFNIYSDDGTEYSMCSSGEKLVIQIKLALLFIKKFNFDFVLCDEGGVISKDNFKLLNNMLKDYQVIYFKATTWSEKDLK